MILIKPHPEVSRIFCLVLFWNKYKYIFLHKGSSQTTFNRRGGRWSKMSTFCHHSYYKKCQRRGVGDQKSQNLVNIVYEQPLIEPEKSTNLVLSDYLVPNFWAQNWELVRPCGEQFKRWKMKIRIILLTKVQGRNQWLSCTDTISFESIPHWKSKFGIQSCSY